MLRDYTGMKNVNDGMREEVKAAEQDSVGMLVNLFDLADGLDLQSTMGFIPPHDESQNIVVNVVTCFTKPRRCSKRGSRRRCRRDTGRSIRSPSASRRNSSRVGSDIGHRTPHHVWSRLPDI